ncbi:MAG: hypothetical protein L0177_18445, partial [Chloroflexi bacterium]|nr:hypothetical protein [Chloroflexota bacterium]
MGLYQFSHALIRQTLESELRTTQRVRLHASIVEAFEELYSSELEGYADELARHAAEAQTILGPAKLVRYSAMAGERALASYAYEEAMAHFQRALAAKEGKPMDAESAATLTRPGHTQAALAQNQNAATSFERAFDYYEGVGDVAGAVAIAENPYNGVLTGLMSDIISRALKLVPPGSIESARLLSGLGLSIGFTTDDYEQAKGMLDEALSIARREGDAALEMLTLSNMANVAFIHLRPHETVQYSLSAIELAPRAQNTVAELRARNWAAISQMAFGDPEEAEHARAFLELAERVRDRHWLSQALSRSTVGAYWRGDWSVAREHAERSLALNPDAPVHLLRFRALLEYQVGAFSRGDAYMDRILQVIQN